MSRTSGPAKGGGHAAGRMRIRQAREQVSHSDTRPAVGLTETLGGRRSSDRRRLWRRERMNLRSSIVVIGIAALVIAGCNAATPSGSGSTSTGGKGPDGALVKRSDIKIEVVTHGQAQDGFWGVVRNGVKAGANDMGVTVNYSAPGQESDMPGMSALIDAAVAKKPTGLVVSIPNPDALSPSIKKAIAAGIPVVSMNSGSDVFKSPRHPRPRRADRAPGRHRRWGTVQGSGRQERCVLQPGSR